MARKQKTENVDRPLSDLERVVLGVIWRDGPCTAYQVRQEFIDSPAAHWSGSQGAIYPLLRKLESRGFVSMKADTSDKRNKKFLSITSEGKKQLVAWFSPDQPRDNLLHEFDAVKTRMFFVQVLSRTQRARYFDNLEKEMRDQQDQISKMIKLNAEEQPIYKIVWEGLLATNKAKLSWVKSARAQLECL